MGTTLTGTTPQDTYDSLIKVTDNGPLSATAKYLSDGLGNDSVLALSNAGLGVGTTTPNIYATVGATNVVGVQAVGTDAGAILAIAGTGTGFSGFDIGNQTIRRAFLGALNGSDFGIYTNPTNTGGNVTERMRITSAGNVGIGTSSPAQKLSVVGGSIFTSRTDSSENIIISDGTVNSSIQQVTHLYLNSGGNSATFGDVVFRTKNSFTEMARFTQNGLCFNGDTAAANALDDYEEGTWTMGVTFNGNAVGLTTSANTGTYTKIGRKVTVNGLIVLTSKGSSTGVARITGLPFGIGSGNTFTAIAPVHFENISFTGQLQPIGAIGDTVIVIQFVTEAGVNNNADNTNFTDTARIAINFTYFV